MRILYHHRTRFEDAQGIHIAEMVKALRSLGHSLEIIGPTSTGQKGITAHLTRMIPRRQAWFYELIELLYNVFGLLSIGRKVATFRPDLIYERYALYTFCGLIVARRFGIPFILEVNAPLCIERSPLIFHRLARHIERWLCTHATHTIVVSGQLASYLKSTGVPEHRLTIMPNGVDPRLLEPNISGEEVRVRYGLENKVVVGFVGWMRSWHSLQFAMETFVNARLADLGAHLFIVGDGPAYEELVTLTDKLGLRSHVTFTGSVARQDIAKYIAAMDVAIQPGATPYASPIKLFEYMAMGRAIVAVAQPNIEEVLQDGENALLFPPNDQQAFGKSLARLIRNEGLRLQLGRATLKTILQRQLFWEHNAKAVVSLVTGAKN